MKIFKRIVSFCASVCAVFALAGCDAFFEALPEDVFKDEVVEEVIDSVQDDSVVEEVPEVPETPEIPEEPTEPEQPEEPADEYVASEPLTFSSGVHTLENLRIVATEESRAAVYAEGAGTVVVINSGYYDGGDVGSVPAIYARDGARIIINGGEFHAGEGNATIYAKNYSYIEINGGTFSADGAWEGNYYVLNLADNTNSKIAVTSGVFVNFNPADNKSENPAVSFVVEGYEVIAEEKESGEIIYTVQVIEVVEE